MEKITNRYKILDTKYFDEEFKWRLLTDLTKNNELDDILDGVLIKSENWQALNLISEKYCNDVQTIYIDPPFNTGQDFLFKDRYQDSSWLSLMENRLESAKDLLKADGSILLHLDWNADYLGRFLLDKVFGKDNFLNEIIWRIGWLSGYKTSAERFVRNHDVLLFYAKDKNVSFFDKGRAYIPYSSFKKDTISNEIKSIMKKWNIERMKNMKIALKDEQWKVYKIGLETKDGAYPIEDTWNCSEYEELHSNKIKRNAKEYTPNGSEITQKPEQLLRRVIELTTHERDMVLDFFLGSATTLAVSHKLNRRWIGVEFANYFETDALYRMKHVLGGRSRREPCGISKDVNWQGGGFFKYQVLEQYEDTLNNIIFAGDEQRQAKLREFEDYIFHILEYGTRGSVSRLSIDQFKKPFDYKMEILENGISKTVNVDLVETFNYLIGLHIKRIYAENANSREYAWIVGEHKDKSLAVAVWRETENLDLVEDKKYIENKIHTVAGAAPDYIYINGDSYVENAIPIETEFIKLVGA